MTVVAADEMRSSGGSKPSRDGLALSLSGGGYRAMLFHLGVLWLLRDCGLLKDVQAFSAVSGGSITAGQLGLNWTKLDWNDDGQSFRKLVGDPIMALSRQTIDVPGGLLGRIPGLAGRWVRGSYDQFLYGGAKLASLPTAPRFTFNATALATGKLFRMHSEYLANWKMGRWIGADITLAEAVAASSAFPPVLSPVSIDLSKAEFLREPEFSGERLDTIHLTDGGVYDNLGIQTIWPRYRTILVSDAGAGFSFDSGSAWSLALQGIRITNIMQDQIASLRYIQMVRDFGATSGENARRGGIISINQHRHDDHAGRVPAIDAQLGDSLAGTKTRLAKLDRLHSAQLVNWGYAATSRVVCDTKLALPEQLAALHPPYDAGH